jgi:hypothetical protein
VCQWRATVKALILNTPDSIGEQATYDGLVVAILDEGQDTYRIQIVDGSNGFSSTCAGYTQAGIRNRAVELAYSYLLKRDGAATLTSHPLLWRPICIGVDSGPEVTE